MADRVRKRFWVGLGLLVALLAASGCITADVKYRHTDDGASARSSTATDGFGDDRTTLEVISAKVGGKNIFIPGTWVVTEGEGLVLSFFNTTDTPHGMSIPALGIAEILLKLKRKGARIREYPATLESRLLGTSKMKTLGTIRGHLRLLWQLALKRGPFHG